jgi:5'-3' exoribonuclease 2
MFIKTIASREEYYFQQVLPNYLNRVKQRKPQSDDPCLIELWEHENLRNCTINDPIKLGSGKTDHWKYRYYEHHFSLTGNQQDSINMICSEYLKGLFWVAKYYFEGCVCWRWQYPYSHAPFLSDLGTANSINDKVFIQGVPTTPLAQLLAVIPYKLSQIIPESYAKLMVDPDSPIIDLFPETFQTDTLYKDSRWKCIPILPAIDIDRIETAVKPIKLDHNSQERNSYKPVFVY